MMNPKKHSFYRKTIAGLLLSTVVFGVSLTPSLSTPSHVLVHATTTTIAANATGTETSLPTLVPGMTLDTGNHDYIPEEVSDSSNWTSLGSAEQPSGMPFSTTLVNNTPKSAGYLLFNGAVDMSKAAVLSGTFSLKASSGTNPFAAGDSLGFILTPPETDIANNWQQAVAGGLGIKGFANSVFAGRDLYRNLTVDAGGTGDYLKASDNVSIRQTDDSGKLITNGYANISAPDAGDSTGTVTDQMTLQWQPASVSSDGTTVTGILTYRLISATATAPVEPISQTITVARSMSIGVVGATGDWYGTLKYDSTYSSLDASKGTQTVQVNYIDQADGKTIASSSRILANVGDTLSVVGKSSKLESNDYSYLAPEIAGYLYQGSSAPLVVANSSDNVINAYYREKAQGTAHFTYEYAENTPDKSEALPVIADETGLEGDAIARPDLPALPLGYSVSSVALKDDEGNVLATYPTLEDALAANPYTAGNRNFALIVSPHSVVLHGLFTDWTGLTMTQEMAGLYGGDYSLPIASVVKDESGQIYHAVVMITKTNFDGTSTTETSGSAEETSEFIQDNILSGTFDAAELSVSVHYVKEPIPVLPVPPANIPPVTLPEVVPPTQITPPVTIPAPIPPTDVTPPDVVEPPTVTPPTENTPPDGGDVIVDFPQQELPEETEVIPEQSEPSTDSEETSRPTPTVVAQQNEKSEDSVEDKTELASALPEPELAPSTPSTPSSGGAASNPVAKAVEQGAIQSIVDNSAIQAHAIKVRAAGMIGAVSGGAASLGIINYLKKLLKLRHFIKK